MKNPPPENSMAQTNANYDKWKDARNVEKALKEWFNLQYTGKADDHIHVNDWGVFGEEHLKHFAKFFAQRCGVVFTDNEPSNNP